MHLKKVGLSLLMTGLICIPSSGSNRLDEVLSSITAESSPTAVEEKPEEEKISTPIPPEPKVWVGKNLTPNEALALSFFQSQGITDRWALSVLLGNIKQESKFHSNICEGGARVKYSSCRRGGYGLIQWTTSSRYWGLGNHARKIGGDPSSINTQLSYLITEREWKKAKQMFLNPNQSLSYYMKGADIWLGWGVYGNRGYYAQQYYKILYIGQT